jgi:hypothetical protein
MVFSGLDSHLLTIGLLNDMFVDPAGETCFWIFCILFAGWNLLNADDVDGDGWLILELMMLNLIGPVGVEGVMGAETGALDADPGVATAIRGVGTITWLPAKFRTFPSCREPIFGVDGVE